MKIRILTSCAGVNFSFHTRQEVEVDDALATGLINGGLAEEVAGSGPETAATKPKGETATAKPKPQTGTTKPKGETATK